MGLFAFLMKYGMNKADNNYIDVSDKIAVSFPEDIYSIIAIKSNLSLRFSKGSGFVNCETFVKNEADADEISVQYVVDEAKLLIDIFSSKKNLQGYINIKLPRCNRLEVKNIYEDICINNIDVNDLDICTNAGDITISSVKFINGSIVTDSGDILVILDTDEYHIKAKSDSGDVIKRAKNKSKSNKTLKCKSGSGDIQIKTE